MIKWLKVTWYKLRGYRIAVGADYTLAGDLTCTATCAYKDGHYILLNTTNVMPKSQHV